MISTLEEAPIRERLEMVQAQIPAGSRDALSEPQALLLSGVETSQDAVRALMALALGALARTLEVPHQRIAEGKLLQAIAILAANPQAGALEPYLARLAPDLAGEVRRNLALVSPAWSALQLEWDLISALTLGWPEVQVDLRAPLGEWDTGPAAPVFQTLLAVATLRAWALL